MGTIPLHERSDRPLKDDGLSHKNRIRPAWLLTVIALEKALSSTRIVARLLRILVVKNLFDAEAEEPGGPEG